MTFWSANSRAGSQWVTVVVVGNKRRKRTKEGTEQNSIREDSTFLSGKTVTSCRPALPFSFFPQIYSIALTCCSLTVALLQLSSKSESRISLRLSTDFICGSLRAGQETLFIITFSCVSCRDPEVQSVQKLEKVGDRTRRERCDFF